jgi:uncharacterized membrane protein YhaH (DUF805 family)
MSIHEHELDNSPKQRIVDDEHLRLLRIGYFVSAAMTGLMAVFGLFYGLIGVFVFSPLAHQASVGDQAPPEFVAQLLGIFGFGFAALALAFAAAKVYVGRLLQQRRSRAFCLVIAALTCLGIPEGTFFGRLYIHGPQPTFCVSVVQRNQPLTQVQY